MHYFFHETPYFMFHSVICLAQAFALFQASSSHVKVEFRLAEITPRPGLTAMKVDGPLQVIYLHKDAIIKNEDIIEAHASEEPNLLGQYEVTVVFTRKGAERMSTATEQESGMLAILIDGKVVVAMGIPNRIYDKAIISGPMNMIEAKNLAGMLNKGSGATR